jgi:hypothetical protein
MSLFSEELSILYSLDRLPHTSGYGICSGLVDPEVQSGQLTVVSFQLWPLIVFFGDLFNLLIVGSNFTTVDCLRIEFNPRLAWLLSIGKSSFYLNPPGKSQHYYQD